MERKFSIIIPTLFRRPDILNTLLDILYQDIHIHEVILIDNTDKSKTYSDFVVDNPKLRVHKENKNLYVNPSWNLGVSMATQDYIAILNDDITIPSNLFWGLAQLDLDNMGIVGAFQPYISQVEKPEKFVIDELALFILNQRTWGFGILMVMNKNNYIPIPEDMLVWCGDDYIFHQTVSKGRVNYGLGCSIQTKMSATSDDSIFDSIKIRDVQFYNQKYKI